MRLAAAVSLLMLPLAALPAGADWLVLRDGARVETRGPWTEKGRLLVFTGPDGRLASLRADTVDLAASRRATAEAAKAAEEKAAAPAAPAPAPPAPRRAVRRITNADIPPGRPAAAGAGAAAEAAAGGGSAAAPAASDLEVRDAAQEIDPFDGHLVVRGRLANTAERTAAAVELVVHAYGPDGAELGALPADLGVEALLPGASTAFEAHFHDVFSGAQGLSFSPAATYLESRPPAATPEPGAPEGGEPQGDGGIE